jgi:hypothetical protein
MTHISYIQCVQIEVNLSLSISEIFAVSQLVSFEECTTFHPLSLLLRFCGPSHFSVCFMIRKQVIWERFRTWIWHRCFCKLFILCHAWYVLQQKVSLFNQVKWLGFCNFQNSYVVKTEVAKPKSFHLVEKDTFCCSFILETTLANYSDGDW